MQLLEQIKFIPTPLRLVTTSLISLNPMFLFNALYRLSYTFSDPTQITVADRDNALQKFKTEFQNYVDNLSEADLTSSNIKTVLSEKADELENSLSTAKMKLSCEVEIVEVHNAGEEIVNN